MNNNWIIFSYSVPTAKNSERVRFWRRISATGAIQLKNSLYILPNMEHLHEQVLWITKEVEAAGGEAAMFVVEEVENVAQTDIQQQFTAQRDMDYHALLEAVNEATELARQSEDQKVIRSTVKKLRKKLEAIRATDYFPSGEFNKVRAALDTLTEGTLSQEAPATSLPQLNREDYQTKTWVTRERPYIDRLATFWLISRHIDQRPQLRFLAPDEKPLEDEIPFDMADGLFSHQGPLITFETVATCFGISSKGIKAIIEVIRPIDLQEDEVLPDDAMLFKRLLDGHINIASDDFALTEIVMLLFDAFEASYEPTKE